MMFLPILCKNSPLIAKTCLSVLAFLLPRQKTAGLLAENARGREHPFGGEKSQRAIVLACLRCGLRRGRIVLLQILEGCF